MPTDRLVAIEGSAEVMAVEEAEVKRYGVILFCVSQTIVISAWGQQQSALGSLLPALPSPHAQISARFLFAEKIVAGAEATERKVRESILQIVGEESVELSIDCRVSICRAGIVSGPDDSSISSLWDAKGTRELLAWETSPLSELAEIAGFDGIAPVHLTYSDGSRQLLLYFFDSE